MPPRADIIILRWKVTGHLKVSLVKYIFFSKRCFLLFILDNKIDQLITVLNSSSHGKMFWHQASHWRNCQVSSCILQVRNTCKWISHSGSNFVFLPYPKLSLYFVFIVFVLFLFICLLFIFRSAPSSPSHMGGSYTPDSLSREGSPIPENVEEVTATSQNYMHHPHPQIIPASSIAELCRISQSAPGSPAGVYMNIMKLT